jgi:aryl-alcohol dehydrogenase-like predicted oxidoreductase
MASDRSRRTADSLMERDPERNGVLAACEELRIGFVPWGPPTVEVTAEFRQRIREEVERRRALGVSAPGEEADDVIPLVAELNDARRLETLAERLLARGHSAARVERSGGPSSRVAVMGRAA